MGYTHYWYRLLAMDEQKFEKFAKDCSKIVDYCINDLEIAIDGCSKYGEKAHFSNKEVWFNGSDNQEPGKWTTPESISIPWPSDKASLLEESKSSLANKTSGNWYAGTLLRQRTAPINNLTGKGEGSYETFAIERDISGRNFLQEDRETKGLFFECCKTAYRPYDLTVTACLIALKHHFPECTISSDGGDKDWLDGQFLCNNILGYGLDFKL